MSATREYPRTADQNEVALAEEIGAAAAASLERYELATSFRNRSARYCISQPAV
jgi:hypothetical protein